ncbi:hypothetical protein FA95DRAFT_1115617 [Auriscalpium vulgare]|uniref:Uncharacterized protein n=1 Tax=Auriscalpium vulgare TaxID=40419 RepID=A0ACB8R4S0_9AGAM|nr:hypothetical protein FA95DRAFT_1115617 [Auriscalpium vulgare]
MPSRFSGSVPHVWLHVVILYPASMLLSRAVISHVHGLIGQSTFGIHYAVSNEASLVEIKRELDRRAANGMALSNVVNQYRMHLVASEERARRLRIERDSLKDRLRRAFHASSRLEVPLNARSGTSSHGTSAASIVDLAEWPTTYPSHTTE